MPQSFQLKVSDYAVPGGPPVAVVVQEKDKGGNLIGRYFVTMVLPQGVIGIVASGSGYMHEIPITENVYQFLKGAGFRAVEYQPEPDPIVIEGELNQTDPWKYLLAVGIGVAKFVPRSTVVTIARNYGYLGN